MLIMKMLKKHMMNIYFKTAKRDEEVTDSIMEHPRSVVFHQAENRLHAQKALLLMMLT